MASANDSLIRAEAVDGITFITLSRPEKLNALTPPMLEELMEALRAGERDPDVHAAVIRGAGRAFCAGHDLAGLPAESVASADAMLEAQQRQLSHWMTLWQLELPVIAAVQGYCLGAGFEIALHCDFILAGADAVFGYPPVRAGIPDTQMFAFRMGVQWAKRLLFSGDSIDADTAARIGLVLRTVPNDQLEGEATALARAVSQVPLPYVRGMKRVLNGIVERAGLETTAAQGHVEFGAARAAMPSEPRR